MDDFRERIEKKNLDKDEQEKIIGFHFKRNVSDPYEGMYGGFFIRFFSFLIDIIIASAISSIILGLLSNSGLRSDMTVFIVLETIIPLLYFTLTTYFLDGQTIGKMIFNLKVVNLKDEKLDFLTVFIREFVGRYIHTFGILPILYILTAFTEKKQNLSDMLADTSVVDLGKVESFEKGKIRGKYEILKEEPEEEILIEEI